MNKNTDYRREVVAWAVRSLQRRLEHDPETRRAFNAAQAALDRETARKLAREQAAQLVFGV